MTRYALYFTPSADSCWHAAGARWLGRDAFTGAACEQVDVPGVPPQALARLTADARRYGFHATLKAPFRLAAGFTEAHLLKMARAFCAVQKTLVLRQLHVAPHRGFLALQAGDEQDEEIRALAMRCVAYFDLLRAAPSDAELARRRPGLTPVQEALLQRWGYPHTGELFHFHMTLTGALDDIAPAAVTSLRETAARHFADAARREPLTIGALTILRETHPGAPFLVWKRFAFADCPAAGMLPEPGRLFFCVGPSAMSRHALLQWTRQHLPRSERIVFARQAVTRPRHGEEEHEALDAGTFWKQVAAGEFSLVWQVHGVCHGIRRSMEADLKAGCDVVVNGDPACLPQLRSVFPDAVVVWIEAWQAAMRERGQARRRETGPAMLMRLNRSFAPMPPADPAVVQIDSSGPLEAAGNRMLGLLNGRDLKPGLRRG